MCFPTPLSRVVVPYQHIGTVLVKYVVGVVAVGHAAELQPINAALICG